MSDIFFTFVVVIIGVGVLAPLMGLFGRKERQWIWLALAAHVVCSPINVTIQNAYGGGDQGAFWYFGNLYAQDMWHDFGTVFPEVVRLFFHQDCVVPSSFEGIGNGTGSMFAVGTVLTFLLDGSLWACCMAVSVAAFFGQLCFYLGLRRELPRELHGRILFATMFLPSVVFWSAALIKEGVALPGLGLLFLGTGLMIRRKFLRAALCIAPGALLVAMIKPYILFAFVLAASAWIFWAVRARAGHARTSVFNILVALGLAFAGIIALGRLFPDYSVNRVSETAASVSDEYATQSDTGGIEMDESIQRGPLAQVLYSPIALMNGLFRPFITDIRSLQMAVNAVETTGLLMLFLRVLPRRSIRVLARTLFATPVLVFAVVFVVTLGVAVGLTTGNLGSISRYRMPLVPFFGTLLLVLSAPTRVLSPRSVASPAAPAAVPPRRVARLAPMPGPR